MSKEPGDYLLYFEDIFIALYSNILYLITYYLSLITIFGLITCTSLLLDWASCKLHDFKIW